MLERRSAFLLLGVRSKEEEVREVEEAVTSDALRGRKSDEGVPSPIEALLVDDEAEAG